MSTENKSTTLKVSEEEILARGGFRPPQPADLHNRVGRLDDLVAVYETIYQRNREE